MIRGFGVDGSSSGGLAAVGPLSLGTTVVMTVTVVIPDFRVGEGKLSLLQVLMLGSRASQRTESALRGARDCASAA